MDKENLRTKRLQNTSRPTRLAHGAKATVVIITGYPVIVDSVGNQTFITFFGFLEVGCHLLLEFVEMMVVLMNGVY